MAQHLNSAQAVFGLCAPADDPGGLQRADAALDQERVAGLSAVLILIVELQRLEGVIGVETVGASQELWAGSHLTAAVTVVIIPLVNTAAVPPDSDDIRQQS